MSRGAALVETAMTMSLTMFLIYGAIQIALLGFFQMQLDGATFMTAHGYAESPTNSVNQATLATALKPLFPNVQTNTITEQGASPPTTDMPVNWTQWGALNNRFGGASILRPQRTQTLASMTITNFSLIGGNIKLTSGNVDGHMMIANHDDDAQGVAYDSATVYGSLVDPLQADDQNVPPYYFNFGFMWYCSDRSFGSACSSGNRDLRALGLAEYLKNDNYSATTDPNNGVGPGGTFATIACHQRIFADLANAFPASYAATQPYAAGGNYDETTGGPNSVAAFGGASFRLVYSWDVEPVHGETSGPNLGQMYPLNPTAGCASGGPGA
ncbi:MAG TPA: TadE family protein [Vicinamibacterales bacterium]|nr:TadE family protein [Vicinamibacterales bacterium]